MTTRRRSRSRAATRSTAAAPVSLLHQRPRRVSWRGSPTHHVLGEKCREREEMSREREREREREPAQVASAAPRVRGSPTKTMRSRPGSLSRARSSRASLRTGTGNGTTGWTRRAQAVRTPGSARVDSRAASRGGLLKVGLEEKTPTSSARCARVEPFGGKLWCEFSDFLCARCVRAQPNSTSTFHGPSPCHAGAKATHFGVERVCVFSQRLSETQIVAAPPRPRLCGHSSLQSEEKLPVVRVSVRTRDVHPRESLPFVTRWATTSPFLSRDHRRCRSCRVRVLSLFSAVSSSESESTSELLRRRCGYAGLAPRPEIRQKIRAPKNHDSKLSLRLWKIYLSSRGSAKTRPLGEGILSNGFL